MPVLLACAKMNRHYNAGCVWRGEAMQIARIHHSRSATEVDIPERFNAAHDLIERNLRAGRANKLAVIDDVGTYTYASLADRARRFASMLIDLQLTRGDRVIVCLRDGIDFHTAFLGAILAGVVPVPINTLLAPGDYAYMLEDSEAVALVVSDALWPQLESGARHARYLEHVLVSGSASVEGTHALEPLLASVPPAPEPAETSSGEPCFWLYSSGSTGRPKGTVHMHASLIQTAALYAQATLGLDEDDVVFSAAKLFFAYGLGNALTFPLSVGATSVLMAERPTPASIGLRLRAHRPTVFSGVPTLFASLLASGELPPRSELALRVCNSAGEALPADVARRWLDRTGVEIIDGIGSTEMLHIFISNRPGQLCYGTLGTPVRGFEAKIVDDGGVEVGPGETGELLVCGPSAARLYWKQPERTERTFQGAWTRTGDRFRIDEKGNYVYAGRADDMLKVGGIYVSPIEVESTLVAHAAVEEAAVVGKEDQDQLIKPIAFVVLAKGFTASDALIAELKAFIRSELAPYKYPRWIEFVDELPKTATGKIQRFKLRALCKPTP
jgi:benzoate-CoA ligase